MISDDSFAPNIGTEATDFFQSDRDLELQKQHERKKATIGATAGDPKTLASKVLAFEFADVLGDSLEVFTAESGYLGRRFNLKTGKTVAVFRGHSGPVSSLAVQYGSDFEARYLFTGSWDKRIIQWDAKSAEKIKTFEGHSDFIKSLQVVGNYLYSSSSDSSIRKWDIATGQEVMIFKEHGRAVEDIAFDDDQKYMFSCSSDTLIKKWDLSSGQCINTFKGHLTSVYSLMVHEGSLWSASADKTVKRWDMETGKSDLSLEHPDFVKCLAFSGRYLVTGCRDENIRLWDIAKERVAFILQGHFGEVSGLAVRGNQLISSGLDSTIRKWSLVEKDLKAPPQKTKAKPVMTLEEEEELAELMED